MAQDVKLIASGLDTNTSELNRPRGSLTRAENVRILRDGVIQPRRGYTTMPSLVGGAVYKLFTYQGYLFAHYGNATLKYYDAGWQNVGSFSIPDHPRARMRTVEANKNLYFTASDGTFRLDSILGTPTLSGAPRALPFDFDSSGAFGTSGFLAASKQCAYRHVLWTEDANGNRIVSSASGRMVVQNTGATAQDVTIEGVLPDEVTTDFYVALYRSVQTDLTIDPPDEMQRVYEMRLDATNISTLQFSITDSVPDDLRDETLYTSPSQEGILQDNARAPLCTDMATYKGCVFYAQAIQPQRFFLDILAVGGTSGIQSANVLVIDGIDYKAGADYVLETGLGSAALNNRATAQNLCTAINTKVTNTTVYAYYIGGPDDFIGKILIEKRAQGATQFFVYVSTGSQTACFNPILPEGSPSSFVVSTSDKLFNGAYFSKQDEPEAVPLVNFIQMGSAAAPVRRVIAARDSLFFLKDDGVWRLNGSGPDDFVLTQVDANCIVVAPESVATLNGRVWALTRQGVVAISESGVELMSYPIESDLLGLMSATSYQSTVADYCWGVGYESDHLYMLGVPTSSGATTADRTYVYSEASQSWVTDTKAALCAAILPETDLLYLGNFVTSDGVVYEERKTRTSSDYEDDTTPISSVVEFSPDALGMPGEAKHFREIVPLFASGTLQRPTSATLTVTTELDSQTFSIIPSTPSPRVLVPLTCRRGTRIQVKIATAEKTIAWQLLGVSILFEPYGPRVNR